MRWGRYDHGSEVRHPGKVLYMVWNDFICIIDAYNSFVNKYHGAGGHNLKKKQTKKGTRAVCLEDSVVDRKLRLRFRTLDEPGINPKKTSSAENPNQTRQVR